VAAVSLDDEVLAELAALEAAHRLRVPRIVDGAQGPCAMVDGREVVNFASNDYLGLAGDARLGRAACAAVETSGAGVGSSRLIVGNHREHVALEGAAADWLRCGGVRLFNAGYAANVGVLTTLLRAGDLVFSDELNHASIIDGCRLSRAEVVIVPHLDHPALEAGLRTRRARRTLVVTESLFSMDGDHADLEAISALCRRHDAVFVLDEAHAVGAVGPEGRGLAAELGVVPDVVIGTFGKALGSFGAFAASTRAIAELLWNRARSLVFSTGLPPSVAAASRAALEIVRSAEGDDRRRTLAAHARRLRQLVRRAGGAATSAIAPVMIGDDRAAMRCTSRLLADGLFVQGIRPPTVAQGTARLRVGLSAGHTSAQLEQLATSLDNALRQ
jgi:8-amino-7-oxononanoate synthase